jgi:hypothetical protein
MTYSLARAVLLLLLLLAMCGKQGFAQAGYRNFIGVNPSITVEPFYNKGELDVNLLPFVYQRNLSNAAHIRFTSIVNYGVRNTNSGVHQFGMEAALPVFVGKKRDSAFNSSRFYIAPVLSLTRNSENRHSNAGLWVEPGYHLFVSRKWAFSFGLQLGATYFMYDAVGNKLRSHFGAKVVFGRWF